jgi:DtxR family transcriptional regulator, Mn-dependent transcriptional regulator
MLTATIQDYLKTIYDLSNDGREASTSRLAARLGVAPASATGMLQHLAALKPPLVTYRKHRGALLTAKGVKAALEVIRHHRLLEEYLVEKLGFSWDSVHEEADRLEHAISEDLEARIDAILDHPDRDPHGELIPNTDLALPADESVPMSALRPPGHATLRRVPGNDAALLRYLDSMGLLPGVRVTALGYSPVDQVLRIQIDGAGSGPIAIGPAITNQLYVDLSS